MKRFLLGLLALLVLLAVPTPEVSAPARAGFLINSYSNFGSGTPPPANAFIGATVQTNDIGAGSPRTFSTVNIGTANAQRLVVVIVASNNGWVVDSQIGVTIAGITADIHEVRAGTGNNLTNRVSIALVSAPVPTGTTASIVVTAGLATGRTVIGVWALYPSDHDPIESVSNGSAISGGLATIGCESARDLRNLNIVNGGVVVAGAFNEEPSGTVTWSWTGADSPTKNTDTSVEAVNRYSFATMPTTEAINTNDLSATWVSGTNQAACVAGSWGAQ